MVVRTTAVFAALLIVVTPVIACPFCPGSGTTLTQDAAQAGMILFGTLSNPQFNPGDINQGSTDLTIETIIKPNPILGDRKVLTLNRYIPVDRTQPVKYLVFCDVFNGKIDAYRGVALRTESKIAEYLKGSLENKDRDLTTRLLYFFKYLDADDLDIANDAFLEFANADYTAIRPVASKLSPDTLVKWLLDPNTPVSRFGLYGSLLGHCGTQKHAAVLRQMIDDPKKRFGTGLDGMMAGYVMLDRDAGWAYLKHLFNDPTAYLSAQAGGVQAVVAFRMAHSGGSPDATQAAPGAAPTRSVQVHEFLMRYAGLRAVRFMHDFRPDLVGADDLATGIRPMMVQDDICDLVIEDLRKWKRWELTNEVIGLTFRKSHDVPIIRRSILRFALQAPSDIPAAADFVKRMREQDEEWVKDVDELLQLESAQKPAPKPEAKK